jgi:membrane protein implicated in regulation of membrane protease activity
MIATDPLSLVFLGCFLFAGLFLVVTTLLGVDHGHGISFHGHIGHVHLGGHGGHAAHMAHANGHASGHAGGHAGSPMDASSSAGPTPLNSLLNVLADGLNLFSLLALLFFFGLLGYLLHNFTNFGVTFSMLVALAIGFGAALLTGALMSRLFLLAESNYLSRDSSRLEGRLGQVSVNIRAGGLGEVIFTNVSGARTSVGARGQDGVAIPAGTEIVIIGYENGIASVQPWDSFMARVRSGNAPALQPIE